MEDRQDPDDIWTATTTVGSLADAERIARELVARKLAACVQLEAGVQSFYVWEGKACQEAEVRLTVKTTGAALDALQAALKALHPYALPQFTAWPVRASADYRDWVRQAVPAPA